MTDVAKIIEKNAPVIAAVNAHIAALTESITDTCDWLDDLIRCVEEGADKEWIIGFARQQLAVLRKTDVPSEGKENG